MHESEFKIVAVSDLSGGYYNENGLDIPAAMRHIIQHGSLGGFAGAERISNEQLLTLDVNMLDPSAIGGVITMGYVHDIKAVFIIDGAIGPIHADADEELFKRNVCVLPDILANAGGVTVSYFEWVQNRQYNSWDLNRVRSQLDAILSKAFEDVWELAAEHDVSLRTAAFMIAIGRVQRATELSGI
jgi:glutamate dehydrogenase (NAD(P)+)